MSSRQYFERRGVLLEPCRGAIDRLHLQGGERVAICASQEPRRVNKERDGRCRVSWHGSQLHETSWRGIGEKLARKERPVEEGARGGTTKVVAAERGGGAGTARVVLVSARFQAATAP